jgi:hypothetical protein
VYLDETWIYQNGTNNFKRWIHETDIKGNPTVVKMEGKRFTILHAGCKDGFLNGCDYLLDAKNNDRDYHKTMTGEFLKSWVEHQLIPALDNMGEKFVVIMDNAPYHCMQVNKPPNMWSTKKIMQEWLMLHNIEFDNTMTKTQLLNLIKPSINHNKGYVIDDILQRHGHTVLTKTTTISLSTMPLS